MAIWDRAAMHEALFWRTTRRLRPGEYFFWEKADLAGASPETARRLERAMEQGGALRIMHGDGEIAGLMLPVPGPFEGSV
jgi:hypothetical protein